DDQSFSFTSFSGCRFIKTPGFDRVAKSGVCFSNCYAGSPGSAPSRSSLVTGRHHWQNEQSGQHASSWMKKYIPMVDMFSAAGYLTGATGKGVAPFRYARSKADSLWRKTNAAGVLDNAIQYTKNHDPRTAKGINKTDYYENFLAFMKHRKKDQPFYFWYGSTEPHRAYEKDSWKHNGKKLASVDVPGFLPDNATIRGDLLDFGVEVEWFDTHLVRMLNYLKSIDELENTIVIVTGDNGMPFPRAKANCFEYGAHVPLAISCPQLIPSGRIVKDPIGFIDLAPTLFELTGVSSSGMLPMSGRSIAKTLESTQSGVVDSSKEYVFSGRERHSSSRWQNVGYPQRAVRSKQYLYLWNMKPERWPAGAPQALKKGTEELQPMYGLDEKGLAHSDWAFTDIDASPSKDYLMKHHAEKEISYYFELAVFKRPEYELYDIVKDPYCLTNLINNPAYKKIEEKMNQVLVTELKRSKDPRMGDNPEVFDTYKRYSHIRQFPKPDWAKN
ncbi:MAG: sulfatase, partial [Massilibacteroides sp.]|nr:sulfatase [Massilibacteroides sp.]